MLGHSVEMCDSSGNLRILKIYGLKVCQHVMFSAGSR